MNERTCLDLFTGLGGFSMAARVNGVRTIAMCESDPFLRQGLERIWQVPVWPDIKTFDATAYRGVWLVVGGPPCQPASRAGQQRGKADDRWLWPQAVRVVAESNPAWFCFENPPGIADVGLDGIILELEGLGYEVQPLRIPACAVDSPQDRDRFWILGHRLQEQHETGSTSKSGHNKSSLEPEPQAAVEAAPVAHSQGEQRRLLHKRRKTDSESAGPSETGAVADARRQRGEPRGAQHRPGEAAQPFDWHTRLAQSEPCAWVEFRDRLYRAPARICELADECAARIPRKFRSKLIGALGNAVVWPIPARIIAAAIQAENQ